MSTQNEMELASQLCSARNRFRELVFAIEMKGYEVIVSGATRTFEEQAALMKAYLAGKGGTVKPAKPGNSEHNYALAIDLYLKKDGKHWHIKTRKQEWIATGIPDLAKSMHFRWGGFRR